MSTSMKCQIMDKDEVRQAIIEKGGRIIKEEKKGGLYCFEIDD